MLVALDGGNSKTEVVVLERVGGRLAERFRTIAAGSGGGPRAVVSSAQAALADAAVDPAAVVQVKAAVAGLDFPGDGDAHREGLASLFPHAAVDVVNDAVAVLDAGAGAGEGLAIVCGAGLNAVARGDRGLATLPALGWPSGDWGGGDDLGRAAVRAAARDEDGRGPRTLLRSRVLSATGAADAIALARAIRDGAVTMAQVGALAEVVASCASEGDEVAAALMRRAADEAVDMAAAVARRAWTGSPPAGAPATLAGGLFSDRAFRTSVVSALRERGFRPETLAFRPVDGLVRALADESAADAAALEAAPSPTTPPTKGPR